MIAAAPPGANGLIRKLTGNGGVASIVANAVDAFGGGFIDHVTYIAELNLALDKLDAFDNQLNAKITNGQIQEPEASLIVSASAAIRSDRPTPAARALSPLKNLGWRDAPLSRQLCVEILWLRRCLPP